MTALRPMDAAGRGQRGANLIAQNCDPADRHARFVTIAENQIGLEAERFQIDVGFQVAIEQDQARRAGFDQLAWRNAAGWKSSGPIFTATGIETDWQTSATK